MTYHGYHPDTSARLHSPALPGSRSCYAPRRDLLRLLWPAALRGILLPLPEPLWSGRPLAVPRSHSRPRMRGGEFAHQGVKDGSLPGGGGGERPRASAARVPLCPFTALHQLLGTHPIVVGPLFAFQDGSYLTRARLGHILRGAFPSSCDLNTHSFRIGGASAPGSMGFSSVMIQALGRWRGDSFRRYVQLPSKYVFHAQLRMLKFSE